MAYNKECIHGVVKDPPDMLKFCHRMLVFEFT